MRSRWLLVLAFASALIASPAAWGQEGDPRTPAGQLAACGGAANWQAISYLQFEVRIDSPQGQRGPWTYRWDRTNGYMRMMGRGPNGGEIDMAIDLGSRTGGGWRDGKQLTGHALGDLVSWATNRFSEDVLWLTFPLQWGSPGVTVTPLPDVAGADGVPHPVVEISSPSGTWRATLDPETGRVQRTVFQRGSVGPYTVDWSDWHQHAGVYFAHVRTIKETGEKVFTTVQQALPSVPPTAF